MVFARLSRNHLNHCHIVALHEGGPAGGASGNPIWHMPLHWAPTLLLQCDGTTILPPPPPNGCWNHACCHTAPQPHDLEASDEKVTVGVHLGLCVSIMLVHSALGERPHTKPDPSRTLRPALLSGLRALPWLKSQSTFSNCTSCVALWALSIAGVLTLGGVLLRFCRHRWVIH